MKPTIRLSTPLILLSIMLGCASTLAAKDAKESHALSSPPAAHADETRTVTIVGVLTRKGPDMDSWWAVTGDDGVVWKLEPANANQAALFQQMQNSRTRVKGAAAGFMLSFPILMVEQIELIH